MAGQYDAEELRIARQRAIAQALRDSGNVSFDPAARAGNLVYKRSPWEDIAGVVNKFAAGYTDRKGDKLTEALVKRKNADAEKAVQGSLDTLAGKSELKIGEKTAPDGTPLQQFDAVQLPGANGEMMTVGDEQNQKRAAMAAALKGIDPQQAAPMLSQAALQQTMQKPKTTVMPYGSILANDETGAILAANERLPGSSTGSPGKELGLINAYREENPGATLEEATAYAKSVMERYYNTEVAGVQGAGSNMRPGWMPRTNIGEVAANASTVKAAEAGGTVAGKTETERFYDAPKMRVAVDTSISKIDGAIKKIDDIAKDPGTSRATGFMSYFPSFRGGKAKDVETAVESLKTQLGFYELQDMRVNSPTGGAVGNVSDTEGRWLQNAIQNLSLEQSEESFQKALANIKEHMVGVKERLNKAYREEYSMAAKPGASSPGRKSAVERAKEMGL